MEIMTKYKEVQSALEAVDDVLDSISMLDNISSAEELHQAMPRLLASLGRYSMSDRSYIFTWASEERKELRMAHEWCAEGVRPTMGEMQHVRMEDMPHWSVKLYSGEPIVFMDWDAEKVNSPEEFAVFDGQDIHALMVIPIFSGKKFNGYIGFDNPDESRTALSLRLLTSVGGHLGSLQENLFMMEELEKKQATLQNSLRELNREKTILDALSIDYTSVYYCDLEADTMTVIKQGEYTNSAVTEQELASGLSSYSFRIQYYFDNFVVQESAPDFTYQLSAAYLKQYLSEHDRFAYRFRTHPNPAGQQYFEVQIVRLTGVDGFKTVMGYRYIDDIIREQEKQKIQLENALAEATLNSEIIDSISKIYWIIYRMDLVAGTYEEISAGQDVHRLTGKHGIITEVFREVRETVVDDEHQEMMKQFLDTSTLPERLRDTDSVAMEYRAASGSWHLGRFIVKKRNEQGQVTNVLYVVRQIDRQKQIEIEYRQQLLETAEEARRANVAKTDFLRRMSHDIRTPINGIQGMVAIAEHFPKDHDRQQECLGKIKEASGFLLDLVNSILDMNKLESGRVVLERQPFNLEEVLQEANSITEMNGAMKGLTISFDGGQLAHPHLIGSPVHLKQILQNISGNAVKYNRQGGTIQLSCQELACADGKVTFRFICADTGRGMSREFLPQAFEPFAQEEVSARTSYMGTGLGLTIVRQLVEMMGGTISVESELQVGTTFILDIPFEIDMAWEEENGAEPEDSGESLSGVHILVAEDNDLNMEIAQFILESAGIHVTGARNGREAVEAFEKAAPGQFDLILMDVMMPVMDGLAATRAIRALDRADAKTIPIFAMTANAFVEDVEASRNAGMDEHLSKPLDAEKMLRTIRRYVQTGKRERSDG